MTQHVIPTAKGEWAVRKSGAEKATRIFDERKEAVVFARKIAKQQGSDVYIHRKDGTIRNRNSYGEAQFLDKRKR